MKRGKVKLLASSKHLHAGTWGTEEADAFAYLELSEMSETCLKIDSRGKANDYSLRVDLPTLKTLIPRLKEAQARIEDWESRQKYLKARRGE